MGNYLTRTVVYALLVIVVGCTQNNDSQTSKIEADAKKQTTIISKIDMPQSEGSISGLTEIEVQEPIDRTNRKSPVCVRLSQIS